jgi:hypothetical protein
MQEAMAAYGTVVKAYAQARSQTDDVLRKLDDPTLTELGLWTDNGAVLFWNDEGANESLRLSSFRVMLSFVWAWSDVHEACM